MSDSQREAKMGALPARLLIHGAAYLSEEGSYWRPHRLSRAEERAITSTGAWHPGLFRQMASTTAGVCLEFLCEAQSITLEVLVDAEPSGSTSAINYILDPSLKRHPDGFTCEVDGRLLPSAMPDPGQGSISFELGPVLEAAGSNTHVLPGLGSLHHVRIWLPCLRGCAVGDVVANGYMEPVGERPRLLVVGDSIGQGFFAGDPARTWPVLLAKEFNLDLANKSLGGQVFQPGTIVKDESTANAEGIVVALGENYRYESCSADRVTRDVNAVIDGLVASWPGVHVWVCSPLFHNEEAWPSSQASCYDELPKILKASKRKRRNVHVVDGLKLMDNDISLLADGFEHPNVQGNAQIAERLSMHLRKVIGRDKA